MPNKAYTTKEKLEAFLGYSLTEDQADFAIGVAIGIVEKLTNRVWVADEEASERAYGGLGTPELPIDECVEIEEVKRGLDRYGDSSETMTENVQGGWYAYPLNYSSLNVPIRILHLRGATWSKGYGNHKITARWGYADEVPADISFATTVIAGGVIEFNTSSSLAGNVSSERIGNYSVSYKTEEGWKAYNQAKIILMPSKSWAL